MSEAVLEAKFRGGGLAAGIVLDANGPQLAKLTGGVVLKPTDSLMLMSKMTGGLVEATIPSTTRGPVVCVITWPRAARRCWRRQGGYSCSHRGSCRRRG
jgi:hypothetical protein